MMYLVIGIFEFSVIFFFNDTATTEIYPLSLHDALPILTGAEPLNQRFRERALARSRGAGDADPPRAAARSEEHTSELQSQSNLVCRLLLEKKKKNTLHILLSSTVIHIIH